MDDEKDITTLLRKDFPKEGTYVYIVTLMGDIKMGDMDAARGLLRSRRAFVEETLDWKAVYHHDKNRYEKLSDPQLPRRLAECGLLYIGEAVGRQKKDKSGWTATIADRCINKGMSDPNAMAFTSMIASGFKIGFLYTKAPPGSEVLLFEAYKSVHGHDSIPPFNKNAVRQRKQKSAERKEK